MESAHFKLFLKSLLHVSLVGMFAILGHVLSIELVSKGQTYQNRHLLNLQPLQPLLTGLSVVFPVLQEKQTNKQKTLLHSMVMASGVLPNEKAIRT